MINFEKNSWPIIRVFILLLLQNHLKKCGISKYCVPKTTHFISWILYRILSKFNVPSLEQEKKTKIEQKKVAKTRVCYKLSKFSFYSYNFIIGIVVQRLLFEIFSFFFCYKNACMQTSLNFTMMFILYKWQPQALHGGKKILPYFGKKNLWKAK